MGSFGKCGLKSMYVLFELGARWGAGKPLIPLLAPGISAEILEGPISNINALTCSSAADLHSLVEQAAETISVKPEPASGYQNELEIVTALPQATPAAPPQVTTPQVSQDAVNQLAELRSEGVHEILNRQVSTNEELQALSSYTEEWWERVNAVLEEDLSRSEQLNFTRLGAVPNVVFPHSYNPAHAKILREFALQERRLLDIIARHTR